VGAAVFERSRLSIQHSEQNNFFAQDHAGQRPKPGDFLGKGGDIPTGSKKHLQASSGCWTTIKGPLNRASS
jgi:hypothetical protein